MRSSRGCGASGPGWTRPSTRRRVRSRVERLAALRVRRLDPDHARDQRPRPPRDQLAVRQHRDRGVLVVRARRADAHVRERDPQADPGDPDAAADRLDARHRVLRDQCRHARARRVDRAELLDRRLLDLRRRDDRRLDRQRRDAGPARPDERRRAVPHLAEDLAGRPDRSDRPPGAGQLVLCDSSLRSCRSANAVKKLSIPRNRAKSPIQTISSVAFLPNSPAAQNPSPMQMNPVIIRSHHKPLRSENAMIRSMIPTNRNMNAVIWAIATKASCGWMNEKIPPRMSRNARNAFNAFHQPLLTTATMDSETAPAIRNTIPASTPSVFTEVMLNLNMISDRISQSVPVIRKIPHQLS